MAVTDANNSPEQILDMVPEELKELTIHFFLAAKVDIFGTNFVKIFLFIIFFNGLFLFPFAINI